MKILGVLAGLSLVLAAAGCTSGSSQIYYGNPVLKASTGSVEGTRLMLNSVDGTVRSDDGEYSMPTGDFITAYKFDPVLPSAGILYYGTDRQSASVMLTNVSYDEASATLAFDVAVAETDTLPADLSDVEIHLQSCPDENFLCAWGDIATCGNLIGPVGTCWVWLALSCVPCDCDKDIKRCDDANPDCCRKHDGCVPARLVPPPQGLERYCL